MDEQIKQITELFAAPKGNLQRVINYGGVTFYTSPMLKQKFIKAMAKSSRSAPVVSTILKLMQKQEFVPCYLTDKILKTLLRKQPPEFKGYAGITVGKYIYVFVDNDTNIFGFASNNDLSITSLHELIHKAAGKFKMRFLSTFKSELITYYKNYWEQLFSIKRNGLNDKVAYEIITFMFNNTRGGNRSNKALSEYYKMLINKFKDITTLDQNELQKLVTSYIVLIKIIWKGDMAGLPSLIEKAVFANRHIIVPLYTAYKTSYGINVKHIKEMCYQELYDPTEVISLQALIKRPSQKVYSIVNKL